MPRVRHWALFPDCRAVLAEDESIQVWIEGHGGHWVPRSVIHSGSMIRESGDEGILIVSGWWARNNGLAGSSWVDNGLTQEESGYAAKRKRERDGQHREATGRDRRPESGEERRRPPPTLPSPRRGVSGLIVPVSLLRELRALVHPDLHPEERRSRCDEALKELNRLLDEG